MKVINNVEKRTRLIEYSQAKKRLALVFKDAGLFSLIIKGHHQLIQTSQGIMKALFSEDLVSAEELNELWDQIVKSDTETRNSLLLLLKECIFDFSQKEVLFFLEKMQEKASQIHNIELVHLLLKIKKLGLNKFFDGEVGARVNQVLWSILQNEGEMKKEFLNEVLLDFTRSVNTLNCEEYAGKIVKNLTEGRAVLRNLKLLKIMMRND